MRVYFDHLRFALFERSALRVRGALCACSALCVHLWAFLVSGVLFLPGVLFAAETVAESGLEHYSQREWSNAAGNTMDGASGNALFKASDTATGRFTDRADSLVKLNSVMDLFVQNEVEIPLPSTNDSAAAKKYAILQQEYEKRDLLRSAMESALLQDRYDDFKTILAEIDLFEKTAEYVHEILAHEKLFVKYFIKNFDFLGNIDSIKSCSSIDKNVPLYDKLKQHVQSGEFDKSLEKIENEGNRTFIRILFYGMIVDGDSIMNLLEQNRDKITDIRQLHYLVKKYWPLEALDLHNYVTSSMGLAVSAILGPISDKIDNHCGMILGIGLVINDFLYEFLLGIQGANYKEMKSVVFQDFGANFNFGYKFLNKKYVNLYGILTAGLAYERISDRRDEKKGDYNFPSQFSPTYGAGLILDIFFGAVFTPRIGLRIRGGVKSIWADDVVNASGYRLYFSVEFLSHKYDKKNATFDYSKREGTSR